jgi:uncharacterized OsmC-like protein
MRNSFYTAGFSEVMHEVKQDPREAAYLYIARARSSPHRGLSASIGPALFGTVKSVRNLTVELGDGGTGDPDGPLAMDLALTGIASCGVTTLLGGGSARELVFDGIEMLIEYGPQDRGAVANPARPVRCRLELDGVIDAKVVTDLVDHMRRFSPNMATLACPVPVRLNQVAGPADTAGRPVAVDEPAAVEGPPAACRVRWISSTQLESYPTGRRMLRVDQPKQLTGVDWGPNPQEYLLMGLAADVADQLAKISYQITGNRYDWQVQARACEDMRGLLLKELDVACLQDVACTVVVPEALASEPGVGKIITCAFAQSEVRDLIARPRAVEIPLHLCGGTDAP